MTITPSRMRGRRNSGAGCARSLVAKIKKHTSSHHVHRKRPAFPAQWFKRLISASPPGPGFLPPVRLADTSAKLDARVGAQDHTTSPVRG